MSDSQELNIQSEESKARYRWISEAAYYLAENRGFEPGHEEQDWLAAEDSYFEMLIASYLSIIEEDEVMTVVSLRKLAREIGIQNPERLHSKIDLIREIQETSGTRPCFQHNPHKLCDVSAGCQWRNECQKMIAVWKR